MPRDVHLPSLRVSLGRPDGRVGVLYIAPWVSYGGTDTGTIDWVRTIDRERFAPYLVTTQPSTNERLGEVYPYAEEVWALPDFLAGQHMQSFIFDLIHTRGIRLVHVMNSRLGFELIPDMAALPHPPGVVVQLHVEEHDQSGYVRLVSTRYGNVVDGFSVISENLAGAVRGYGVAPEKIAMIPLGVDAHGRFDPGRVEPLVGLDPQRFHVLHTGRLTAQKDPLLAVEAMRRVVDTHAQALLHVVGEGELEPAMRERARELGLSEQVTFHPMSRHLERWYAGCDALLMTSLFEGIPCVVYEAMAMATPIVAPALPGNCELMGDTGGLLVEPRDDAAAYAAAVCRLIDAPSECELLGGEGRQRVVDHYTIEAMAAGHAQLYERVLKMADGRERRSAQARADTGAPAEKPIPTLWDSAPPEGEPWGAPGRAHRLRFAERPIAGQPLVSAIVPCFNHGRYLPECVGSILDQNYPAIEVIVVDDASTEESTLEVLAQLDGRKGVTVLRQPENGGPSAARNRGIEAAQGHYILPVDSDNLLIPDAIAALVKQLQSAGEQVGFVYPNCQYFGTRDDYFQPPAYNLYLLMSGNYCDTCSLIDRAVFDAGIRYPEHIVLGHEDWDFALTLAARGVRGEPARMPTLRYRKEGFTRSDAVEYARHSFHEGIPERHPELFGEGDPAARYGRYWAPAVDVKARWAPGLSIVLTVPVDFADEGGRALLSALERQTCRDFEVVLECPTLPEPAPRTQLRRLPPGLCVDAAARLQQGLDVARGPYLLAIGAELAAMAAEPGFVERLFRTVFVRPGLAAIAFVDGRKQNAVPHHLLRPAEVRAPAHALFWERTAQRKLPPRLMLQEGLEVESLARAMSLHKVALQWRHAAGAADSGQPSSEALSLRPYGAWLELPGNEPERGPHWATERKLLDHTGPVIPALPWTAIRRWLGLDSWIPPETELLTRHRESGSKRRIVRRGAKSPPGYELEFHLGAIQRFAPPGTIRLVSGPDGVPRTEPRGSPRSERDDELGHLEEAPLPLLNAIQRAVLPDGSTTLISTERDPLRTAATHIEHLGFIEGYPNEPVRPPDMRFAAHGRASLLRCLDAERRRHFYRTLAAGEQSDVVAVGELGALHLTAEPDSIPVWFDRAGRVCAGTHRPGAVSPSARQLARWVGAPATWRGFGRARGRARAVVRRGSQAAVLGLSAWRRSSASAGHDALTADRDAVLAGYLYSEAGSDRRELFAAVHPVTGDQLLTLHPLEAADMGYGPAVALGFVLVDLPFTGTLAMRRVAVPWASRFGLEVRRA